MSKKGEGQERGLMSSTDQGGRHRGPGGQGESLGGLGDQEGSPGGPKGSIGTLWGSSDILIIEERFLNKRGGCPKKEARFLNNIGEFSLPGEFYY